MNFFSNFFAFINLVDYFLSVLEQSVGKSVIGVTPNIKNGGIMLHNKIFSIVMLILFSFVMIGFAADKPEYVGASKCKACHNSDKKGAQFKKWESTKHASAYTDLKGDNAKKKAEAMGVKDPLKDEKCLSCHTTASGAKNVETSYKIDEGVGCEACHGPGSLYRKNSVMKDQKAAVAVGMVIPDEKTCKNCHKPDTKGHDNKFKDFKTEYAKIAHEMPKAK